MLKGNTNAEKIYDYLISHGLTEIAAFGLLGNMQAESGLNPWNLQNSYEAKLGYNDATYTAYVDNGIYHAFATDKAGYGLCQWTSEGRKQGLLAHAKETGRSIGDMEMQLEWLVRELNTGYKSVLSGINKAKTIREASDIVLTKFERPKDQGEAVKILRANNGETIRSQITGTKVIIKSDKPQGADSSLVSAVDWNDNNYGKRSKVTGVTIHHMAGDMTIESCMKYHRTCGKSVSANYYIGSDGRIGQAVPESKAAYTSSNKTNDMEKITIEVANSATGSPWKISDAAYKSLVNLVADICTRHKIPSVNYTGDKNGVITEHRMFTNTTCPGETIHDYLKSGKLVKDVNEKLGNKTEKAEEIKEAQPKSAFFEVTASMLNIRSGPTMDDLPLMVLSRGSRVVVKAIRNGWAELMPGGMYCDAKYLKNWK